MAIKVQKLLTLQQSWETPNEGNELCGLDAKPIGKLITFENLQHILLADDTLVYPFKDKMWGSG